MKIRNHSKRTSQITILGLTALAAASAQATDGYFDYGYGTKAKGIGGAGVAFPQDSLAPASNPAGAAFLDNRFDIGVTYFQPDRSSSFGPNKFDGNATDQFYIPEIGFKHSLTTNVDFALAVYGNGGMNTDYTTPVFGTSRWGIDFSQLFVAPTLSYKLNENHAIGLAPIVAYQRFRAYGLENFGVGNNSYDNSYGGGVRIGYTGKLTDWLTVGLTYQSRIFTTPFDKYKNLFAEHGSFDVPENFALGFALKPNKSLTFALDVEEILYSEVKSVGNNLSAATFGNGLGSNDGPGFGWRDVTAVKTGIPAIAGYEHSLLEYATQALATIPGLRPIGTATNKASVLSFVIPGIPNEYIAKHLDKHGIAVRAGHHCAQPAIRHFGLESSVRPSLAFYNTREEVDGLVRTLRSLKRS